MKRCLAFGIFVLLAAAAAAQEIGFIETFALAPDRSEALRELVPGTDDYFYFHALHAQNEGRRADFQDWIERWTRERRGTVASQARELLNRQALLDYEAFPDQTLAYLRDQLHPFFGHARKTGERRSSAPSRLDPRRISAAMFLREALHQDSQRSLERIETAGLDQVAAIDLNGDQRRNLLSRLQRPDFPGIVDHIVADLDYRDSRGFGHHDIHRRLTLAQLDELLVKKPGLRNQTAFVNAYLSKLAPSNEVDLETDADARQAYFERVWAFVQTLDPVHNSLKANVLHGRLLHDQKQGVYDAERFMAYVRLPRDVPYLAEDVRKALPRGDHLARLHQSFGLLQLPPIHNEEPLVRDFLLHFLVEAPDVKAYTPFLRDDFLQRLFAEAKITSGFGDPAQWSRLLPPDEFRRLKERVDIDFSPANPDVFDATDPVRLTAFVKNVPSLIVKVYEINTLNYYRETGRPLNLAINLDGLVASSERRLTFPDAPELRSARVFEFPELDKRGAYVVELIGNGKSSRALVQKGRLGVLQEITAAGQAFTVLDESNRSLPDARAWFGSREFLPDAKGRLVIPFSTDPRPDVLVVHHDGFASLVRFHHLAESYDFQAGIYVDREALLRREKATLALRPVLRVNGRPASLALLEDPRLVLRAVDLDGIATESEIPGLVLRENAEILHEFTVPENAVSLTVTLKAKVQNISRNRQDDLASSATFALNGIDRTVAVQDLHAGRTAAGYIVDLRGKNGEPRPGEPLSCRFKHRDFRDEIHVALKTDENGRVVLGNLPDIERFSVREPFGTERTWPTTADACSLPAELHAREGDVLRLPAAFPRADAPNAVSLLEQRQGQFVQDWHNAIALSNGFLEIHHLPAGDYSLFLKPLQRDIAVRITRGVERDGFVLSPSRALERPRLAPLHISAIDAHKDTVEIRLANASPFARVHVVASRYLPAYDLFDRLGPAAAPGLLQQPWPPARSFYESGRDIGDEYRYILDRQSAPKFPGNRLDRPGLLLHPWALRDTEAEFETLAADGAYAGRTAPAPMAQSSRRGGGRGSAAPQEGLANLDFLRQPAVTLWNLVPGKDGILRIPRADLHGLPLLRVLAADPVSSVLKFAALDDSPVQTRDLRQTAGLDPAKPFAEQKIITPLPPKASLDIGDVSTARFETCDSLSKAYRLLATLGTNPTFEEFSFVATWPALDAKERQRLYSKYACHELNFFLHQKDPAFFKKVVAPALANKKDKTFMDLWLLDADLSAFLEPWRFARLNAVERVLLARRLPDQAASLVRDARDRADLIPPDAEDFNRRFDTALLSGSLDQGGDMKESIERARQAEESRRRDKMDDDSIIIGYDDMGSPIYDDSLAMGARMMSHAAPLPDIQDFAAASPVIMKNLAPGAMANRSGAARGRLKAAEEMPAEAESLDDPAFLNHFYDRETAARQQAQRRFFQKLDPTKEWAENNYYHLPIEQQNADLVPASDFWADYAEHDGQSPFLSEHFTAATRSFTEMMLALAVLDLPFEPAEHQETLDGLRYALSAASPLVVFHREILEAQRADEPASVLVAQHFFRADDRYRYENNEQFDQYVDGEFLPHVVYGAQIVLTNPQGNRQKLDVLLQIPMGALPVQNGFYTRGIHVDLAPHATQTLEYFFYFPATGTYPHYPVSLAQNNRVVGAANPFSFHVVPQLSQIDTTSWAWISQNGSPEDVLAFLQTANLHRLDLGEIAWRMKDKAFFKQTTDLLASRHVYHDALWSYGLHHNDPDTLRAWLEHSPFADRCGLHLVSPLLTLDPVERLDYQHLEYAPLINPRAHPVGAKRKILNAAFLAQYQNLMTVLSQKAALSDVDELAVAYYMTLQDRVAEALDWRARVDRRAIPEQLQCDYLDVYLAFYRGDTAAARRLATAHARHPVDRWRVRFEQALAQLDEIESGGAASAADPENRDQAQDALAGTEPVLELLVEAGQIRLDARHLGRVDLNFYPMDVELLFSRHPFLQDGAAQFSFIRPVLHRTVDLSKRSEPLSLDLPDEFRTKNVMVEAVAAGLRRTQAYYANTLKVQLIEPYGQLFVTHADTHKPVPGAYVKVYARMNDGEIRFLKDGYTDLRGRFDYASVNSNELDHADRLALLILSDDFGAVVREAAPPKR
ncbi:MAG: transcription antitermination protein NusB [Lentisphaerae bacterium]|nr:transcription antitermination protein NusB [Lentisphaerota bacterium]